MKTRVRGTSETVMDDTEIQYKRHRVRLIRKVSRELDVPTMLTPTLDDLLCFYSMCGADKEQRNVFGEDEEKKEKKARAVQPLRIWSVQTPSILSLLPHLCFLAPPRLG
jgi:hypothetical protein